MVGRSELRHEPHQCLFELLGAASAAGEVDDPAAAKRLAALAKRVDALEARRTASARRAAKDAHASSEYVGTKWVPRDYYGRSMRQRAAVLRCAVPQMCKSMLVENKQWKGDDPFARDNARHYLVVVQYAATFNALALRNELARRTGLSNKSFNFRVADAAECAALSGFEHNAVTPFGMAEARVPVVLAAAAARAPDGFVWMGGGHTDFKLGVPVADFLQRFDPLVLGVSDARPEAAWDDAPTPGGGDGEDGAPAAAKKAPKKEKKPAPPKKGKAADFADYGDDADTAASRLALVVGKIVDCWPHPESDKLFCERIDCGEAFGGVREIASGLQKFYETEDLKDRMVLVAANLKAKKLGGFPSQGMVLCASNDAHDVVKFVDPPPGASPGDRVALEGLPNPHASDAQVDKKKLFLKAQPHFVTKGGVCFYKDKPLNVGGKPCTAPADDGWAIS